MGVNTSSACSAPIGKEEEELRLPWALAQAERFESEDCPFCALRRSHCTWLRTEIKRLTSEVACLETTIPPKFFPELERRLQESPLPDSMYTGGVDDVRGTACPRCIEQRTEVKALQGEARSLDAQCKARIEFHRSFARRIESLLIEKRRVEARLFFGGQQTEGAESMDGKFCAITKVNQIDEDVILMLLKQVSEEAAVTDVAGESDGGNAGGAGHLPQAPAVVMATAV
mmetsp:Transcript_111196/g.313812  ORF Transcript_111196/g.313812 Transcript_111196/m.313812 type:complete len:229 (-) Transcript_111196:79-765(-)|eukprot:CAMPEP_0117551458 /NCGR_PEP_ID=MMETSP0784-20121206/49202_1 /TAXON_ID=39447 /ORGANISM="" /LENGTH=228 /DNA_ID=CAMNT_0005348499 /DNA_START=66 /DNA_END=752 /DNA_ORIENTATION=-